MCAVSMCVSVSVRVCVCVCVRQQKEYIEKAKHPAGVAHIQKCLHNLRRTHTTTQAI